MNSKAAEQHADFRGNAAEIIFHHLGTSGEAGTQYFILRRDSHRTGIEMALARHDAAHRQERSSPEAELVRAEQSRDHDVTGKFETTIHPKPHMLSQAGFDKRAVCVAKAKFPGHAGVLDRAQG